MANTAFSDYTEANIVKHIFRSGTWTKTANLYFGLLTAAPSDTGGGTEVTGGNYARVGKTPVDSNFSVTAGVATNLVYITFPVPNASWGTVTHIGVYDASSGGNLLLWSDLAAPKAVGASDPAPFFAPGSYVCTYNSTSTELATQVLSFIFKTLATWTKPSTLYFDFYTNAPSNIGGGTKATGGSYSAVSITPADANFTQTVNGSNGTTSIANTADIVFPAPTADWGIVTALGISTSAGMYIGYATFAARTINNGDAAPVITVGNFTWAVN
jgi:hypothetical protein